MADVIDIVWDLLNYLAIAVVAAGALIWYVVSSIWGILPDGLTVALTYLVLGVGIVILAVAFRAARDLLLEPATKPRPRPAAPATKPGLRLSPAPPRDVRPVGHVQAPAKPRCKVCVKANGKGKRIYADEDDAWNAVRKSKERFAAGKPTTVVQRAYYEERCGNWHVTSQDVR